MKNKLFSTIFFLLTVLAGVNSNSEEHKIAAVVNGKAITSQEVNDRMQFFLLAGGENLSSREKAKVKKNIINELIDEKIVEETAEKLGLSISNKELSEAIASIEKNNNLPTNYFSNNLARESLKAYNSFKQKIKNSLLQRKIVTEVMVDEINVNQADLNKELYRLKEQEVVLNIKIFSIDSTSPNAYKKLSNIRTQTNCCANLPKLPKEVVFEEKEVVLSELPQDIQFILNDLPPNNFSALVEQDGKIITYQVCEKKINNLKDEAQHNLIQYIGNKKLIGKAQKFFQDLRKQAYIKIY